MVGLQEVILEIEDAIDEYYNIIDQCINESVLSQTGIYLVKPDGTTNHLNVEKVQSDYEIFVNRLDKMFEITKNDKNKYEITTDITPSDFKIIKVTNQET